MEQRGKLTLGTRPGAATFNRDEVYTILRGEILTLRVPPGKLLSENQISKRFNISRTPVRGVFERLQQDDLLEVIPRKGTFVTLIDLDLAEQFIFMRINSELSVLRYLARHPDAALLDKLGRNLEKQKLQLEFGVNADEFFRLDMQFHELCMISLNKYKLWRLIQDMNVHYYRYRQLDYQATQKFDVLYEEHCALYGYLQAGDIGGLRRLITGHLYGGILRIDSRLISEYAHYFSDTERGIDQIILDVKMQINDSLE